MSSTEETASQPTTPQDGPDDQVTFVCIYVLQLTKPNNVNNWLFTFSPTQGSWKKSKKRNWNQSILWVYGDPVVTLHSCKRDYKKG